MEPEDSDALVNQARRDRRLSTCFVVIVVFLGIADIIEDILLEKAPSHIWIELVCILVALTCALYLWAKSQQLLKMNLQLNRSAVKAHKDAEYWKEEAAQALRGLGEAIEKQFDRWGLSAAEKEVGLLLLKGLSHKEIAEVRETSERTVRQQAAAVYSKAGLGNRAHLSAFFLEDLLLPQEPNPKN